MCVQRREDFVDVEGRFGARLFFVLQLLDEGAKLCARDDFYLVHFGLNFDVVICTRKNDECFHCEVRIDIGEDVLQIDFVSAHLLEWVQLRLLIVEIAFSVLIAEFSDVIFNFDDVNCVSGN